MKSWSSHSNLKQNKAGSITVLDFKTTNKITITQLTAQYYHKHRPMKQNGEHKNKPTSFTVNWFLTKTARIYIEKRKIIIRKDDKKTGWPFLEQIKPLTMYQNYSKWMKGKM